MKATNQVAIKLTDTLYRYKGFRDCDSVCGLRVYERADDYPRNVGQPAARVVVLTELPENDGTSVTNVAEQLAAHIFYDRELMGFPSAKDLDDLRLPIEHTVFVEHYPDDLKLAKSWGTEMAAEHFDLVTFRLLGWNSETSRHEWQEPQWRRLTSAELEAKDWGRHRRKIAGRTWRMTPTEPAQSVAVSVFPALPPDFVGASTRELADRYIHLSAIKLAGETRAGCHPSGFNDPSDVETDPAVQEVLKAGLHAIVFEMAAVMHELHNRPGGMTTLLPGGLDGVAPDFAA